MSQAILLFEVDATGATPTALEIWALFPYSGIYFHVETDEDAIGLLDASGTTLAVGNANEVIAPKYYGPLSVAQHKHLVNASPNKGV